MERPAEPLEVELGTSFWVVLIVGALFTLGIAAAAAWFISLRYPRTLDRDGVTTRGGARHPWDTLRQVLPMQKGGLRLDFQRGHVLVLPRFFANPLPVLDYLQRCGVDTGVNLSRPAGRPGLRRI